MAVCRTYFTKGRIIQQVHVLNYFLVPNPTKKKKKRRRNLVVRSIFGKLSFFFFFFNSKLPTKGIKTPNYILNLSLFPFTSRILCNQTEYFLDLEYNKFDRWYSCRKDRLFITGTRKSWQCGGFDWTYT